MSNDVLVKVEGVSKKFCRSLKRSLWYGVQDVSAELFGRKGQHNALRKNEFWAVDDVSFQLRRGECLGLIGPNGAGKSTLLKMLNGLVKPDKGRITMRGRIGALIELGAGFNPILTARENIYINGSVLGFSKKEIDRKFDAIIDFAEIDEFVDTPVRNFSSGMKVRLGFAIAAQMKPDVLLIDEVLAVGGAGFRAKCFTQIAQSSPESVLLLVSHSMSDLARTASSVMVINQGKTIHHSRKVATGIEHYNELFRSKTATESGTKESRLLSTRIVSERGAILENVKLRYLDTIRLEIEFLLGGGATQALINLGLVNEKQELVAQCSSIRDGFFVSGATGIQKVKIELGPLPLSLGNYSLTLHCVEKLDGNRRGRVYFHNSNAAAFSIFDDLPGYSSVHVHGKWQMS